MQNIVILAGNIGQTPEVRTTQSGTKITNFRERVEREVRELAPDTFKVS